MANLFEPYGAAGSRLAAGAYFLLEETPETSNDGELGSNLGSPADHCFR